MRNTEDNISQDEDTGMEPDESSVLSNADQDQSFGLDELYSFLGDSSALATDESESAIPIEGETPLAEEVSAVSALDELEALYGGSDESTAVEAESVSDGVSVLEELEVMYGSSDESATVESETSSNIEEPTSESASYGDSVLEELEALLGSSVESAADDVEAPLEATENSSNEGYVDDMSALDELRVFLGETPVPVDSESADTYAGNDEYLFESRKSVLDELQSLIQSCIDELKATTDGNIAASLLSTEAEYPTRDELKNLLESKLSQLMMIADDSATLGSGESASVLDELNALLDDASISNTYISSSEADASPEHNADLPEEIDEYISSAESGYESAFSDEITGVDSVLEEFEGLLSGSSETSDSELAQDALSTSAYDTKTDGNSVLEDMEASSGVSSELLNIDDSESLVKEIESDCISASSDSASNVLEQLEAMLGETDGSGNDETNKNIKAIEDDSILQQESSFLPAKSEEKKDEDTGKLSEKVRPSDAPIDSQIQKYSVAEIHFSDETENNKRLPMVSMLLVAAALVGVIIFWNLSDSGDVLDDGSQLTQSALAEKSVTVETKSESDFFAQAEVEPVVPVLADEVNNIDDLLASVESSGYDKKPSYENELYENPVQSYIDEPLDNEEVNSKIERNISQIERSEVANEIQDSRLKESINQQLTDLQDNNEKSIGSLEESVGLLSERMIEAESSISRLQIALEKSEQPVVSKVNDGGQINQVQDKNEENIGLLNKRVIEAESSISKLQLAIEKPEQLEPVQSVSSIVSKMNARQLSKDPVGDLKDKTYNIWSVHLFSYYGKPPPASELEFLNIAEVPYQIEKAIVNEGVWYRVLVNNSSEYRMAKKYAEMLKKRLGMKKIWISKKQYTYD